MAPTNAAHGEPSTTKWAVFRKRLRRIAGAAWVEPASWPQHGGDEELVEADQANADPRHTKPRWHGAQRGGGGVVVMAASG
jgi:hypothetical protein